MKEKRKHSTRSRGIRKFLLFIFMLTPVVAGIVYVSNRPPTLSINPNGDDLLFYTFSTFNMDDPNENMLMIYNPRTNQRQALVSVGHWKVSPEGLIAYHDGENSIVVRDIQSIGYLQARIESQYGEIYISSWSPHSNYLLYSDRDTDHRINRLYVWDGEQSVDISPLEWKFPARESEKRSFGWLTWNDNEKLAFIASRVIDEHTWYRIYIWDGEQTIDITPESLLYPIPVTYAIYFRSFRWNDKDQLAINLTREDAEDIFQDYTYLWDGKNAHQLVGWNEGWSSDGHLMISHSDGQSVGQWDGQSYIDCQLKIEPIPDLNFDSRVYRAVD